VVVGAVVAQQLLPLRSILGLTDVSPCVPSLASARFPGNAAAEDGHWRRVRGYPTARDEVRAAAVSGDVYVGSGVVQDDDGSLVSLDEIFRFDPKRGTYRELPPIPSRVDHAAFVGHADRLYVIGGYQDEIPTAAVWRYSPSAGNWDALAPMPTRRGAAAAAAIGGKIYVVGGSSQRQGGEVPLNDLEIYDVATDTWTTGPGMRVPRHHHGAASVGGQLVVVGGRNDDDLSVDAVERFDPSTGEWTTLAPLPLGAGGLAVTASEGQIVAVGGGDDGENWVTPAAWGLRPGQNGWRRLADLNVARHGLGAAAVGSDVYVFGGAPCPGYGRTEVVETLSMASRDG
jgi:N-acetylneuraminic acid mutarotase